MIGILSSGILRIPNLASFLDKDVSRVGVLAHGSVEQLSAIAGWGQRPSTKKAREFAAKHELPFIALEDGFLRSVGLGKDDLPLSIVVDDAGIYYDARQPSKLENLVGEAISDDARNRALALVDAWQAARISKYNHLRNYTGTLPDRYVLVVDQTFGDASIQYGLANAESFQRMLEAALAENSDCTILVKIHPDVFAGRKKGHFDPVALSTMPRVQVLAQDVHPVSLIERAEAVYAVTSQMGFEGLLWGKRVRTFGMPFYAGWGLTQDELPAPERRKPIPLENLVYAALVEYPRYIDPETGKRCEPERLIEWMGLQRKMRERFPEGLHAVNFSRWKKPIVRDFLQGSSVRFIKREEQVSDDAAKVLWGIKGLTAPDNLSSPSNAAYLEEEVKRPSVVATEQKEPHVIRLEDGFLRSVGLGADLIRPLSWVADSCGIYYDSTRPSDLEHILQHHPLDEEILSRAKTLRKRIVSEGLTKYNVGSRPWQRPSFTDADGGASWKRVILVPGQVETDASIAFGAPGIRRNMDLLRAVRQANPDAYIVYKPHPDVVAGLRKKGMDEENALEWCDEIVLNTPMGDILNAVDEVHVITSLAGFEALLRGKNVATYGQPFYSGWGLTKDFCPVQRRTRRLSLDELVAGTLILYPTYVSRSTGKFTTPERALDELLEWRAKGASTMPLWRRLLRFVLQISARNK